MTLAKPQDPLDLVDILQQRGEWTIGRWQTARGRSWCGPIGPAKPGDPYMYFPDGGISPWLPLFTTAAEAQAAADRETGERRGLWVDEAIRLADLHFSVTAYDAWSSGPPRTVYDGGEYNQARAAFFMVKGLLGDHPRYQVRIVCPQPDRVALPCEIAALPASE